jgi:hypothetical protein
MQLSPCVTCHYASTAAVTVLGDVINKAAQWQYYCNISVSCKLLYELHVAVSTNACCSCVHVGAFDYFSCSVQSVLLRICYTMLHNK